MFAAFRWENLTQGVKRKKNPISERRSNKKTQDGHTKKQKKLAAAQATAAAAAQNNEKIQECTIPAPCTHLDSVVVSGICGSLDAAKATRSNGAFVLLVLFLYDSY
jgi:hypothetical protein